MSQVFPTGQGQVLVAMMYLQRPEDKAPSYAS